MSNAIKIAMPCSGYGNLPVQFEDNTPSGVGVRYHIENRSLSYMRVTGISYAYREACVRYSETILSLLSAGF